MDQIEFAIHKLTAAKCVPQQNVDCPGESNSRRIYVNWETNLTVSNQAHMANIAQEQ